ncbi:MAG: hypothetical protein RR602_00545 [Longicatena sp.]
MNIKLIILCIIIIILLIAPRIAKQVVYKKLTKLLSLHEYESFEKLLDGFVCTFSFRPFNREYMRLTAYLMSNDKEKIEGQFDNIFKRIKMKDAQKLSVAKRGFYFYLENKNFDKTKKMLTICKKSDSDGNELHNMQLMYDILVLQKSDYISEIKERLESLKKVQATQNTSAHQVRIGVFEYLLGLQYLYQNNKKSSKNYLESALSHCKNTPYENQILSLLNQKGQVSS